MKVQFRRLCRYLDKKRGIVLFCFERYPEAKRRNIMKAKSINSSSKKTRESIKRVFAEMLSEKKEIGKISVSELCRRAEIHRGTFYSHYDDIYAVAEDFENELLKDFFDNNKLSSINDIDKFVDSFFDYIRKNEYYYRMLCKSNEIVFTANRLTLIAERKFYEVLNSDARIKDKEFLEMEINVFIEGFVCEYVKHCRGYGTHDLEYLYRFAKRWKDRIRKERF